MKIHSTFDASDKLKKLSGIEEKQNKSFWDEKYSTFDASEKSKGDLF